MTLKANWQIMKNALSDLSKDNITSHAASLAFYTIFSIAPLLIIAIALAGLFFGEAAARGEILNQLKGVMGEGPARAIEDALKNARQSRQGYQAVIIGLLMILVGATTVFAQLQSSLNYIWKVQTRPGINAIKNFFRKRLMAFFVVISIGALLLASLVLTTSISALQKFVASEQLFMIYLFRALDVAVSLLMATVLFGAVYKILPDVNMQWGRVWIGSLVTAVLFTLGKYAIGLYLGKTSTASTYGAAGSLVVVLLWVYYSSIIFYLGAEFIRAYALFHGEEIEPAKNAVRLIPPHIEENGTSK